MRDQALIPTPEVTVTPIKKGDMILLACDGIWDVVSNDEAAGIVSAVVSGEAEEGSKSLAVACDNLLTECLKRDSRDNMTAMLVRIDGSSDGEGITKKLPF